MAKGDLTYARGNVDWPSDPRCHALPDNDARWLHECMWRSAVKEHNPTLSDKYTAGYFAALCHLSEARVAECIKAIAAQNLIAFTPEWRIVVLGVRENHPKLSFRPYPETTHNPYLINDIPIWGDTGGYGAYREREGEREKEGEYPPSPLAGGADEETATASTQTLENDLEALKTAWNASAARLGLPRVERWSEGRKRHARRRLKDAAWRNDYPEALERLAGSSFCCGKAPGGRSGKAFKGHIDWFLRPDTVAKLLEGFYDDGVTTGRVFERDQEMLPI